MRKIWLALVSAILASSCDRPPEVEPFNELDRDGDNRISREEASTDPSLAPHFSEVDDNSDGELSAREYLQAATTPR